MGGSLRRIVTIGLCVILVTSMAALVQAEEYPKFDLGGETVSFVVGWDGWYQLFFGQFQDGEGKAWKEEVEKMFNCKIEFKNPKAWPASDEEKQAILAGDEPNDILIWHSSFMKGFGFVEFSTPAEEFVEEGFWQRYPNIGLAQNPEKWAKFGRQTVLFPAQLLPAACRVVMWNKTLFEREGLPNLYELVENNEWTWDKMIEIANLATKDTDGDGEIDQWGFWIPEGQIPPIATNGGRAVREIDGKLVYTANEPAFIEGVRIANESLNIGEAMAPQGFHENQSVWKHGKIAMRMVEHVEMLDYPIVFEIEDDFGVVPPPMGPNVDSIYSDDYAIDGSRMFGLIIPKGVKNPRAKIEVANALFKLTVPYIDPETGLEDAWMAWAAKFNIRDEETLEMMKLVDSKVDAHASMHYFDVLSDVDMASPAAGLNAKAPVVQAMLDEEFN